MSEWKDVTQMAESIARVLHAEQLDRQGQPYIEHLRRVADGVEGAEAKAVAWLHDSLEDVLTGQDGYLRLIGLLRYEGARVSEANLVVRCVDALTRSEIETYEDYIERIAARSNPIISAVKLADLRDNLRPCPNAEHLHARYRKAIDVLEKSVVETRG